MSVQTQAMPSSLATLVAKLRRAPLADFFPAFMLAAGFVLRLDLAYFTFLNPDEALHYLLSVQPSAALAYRASLTTVHPPLLILWLHYWGSLGHSEFWLRLPCVLAGTAFCWISYRWLQSVTDDGTARIALALLSFLPPLVLLSAELRQYAFLLLFMSLTLYLFDQGLKTNSASRVAMSALFLCLSLLTHYAAFMFAAAFGMYGFARFYARRVPHNLIAVWMMGQLAALALAVFLVRTHVSRLDARGVVQGLASGWFRISVFHPGEEGAVWFLLKANLRFFHYLCWSGAIGALALILFGEGIVLLFKGGPQPMNSNQPTRRQLGLLLLLPFVINLVAAFAGKYPYGGTRHNAFLAIFAVTGISVTLARWKKTFPRIVVAGIAVALTIVNLFPSPSGASIRPEFQTWRLMNQAMRLLSQLPEGSTILTDQQGALLLSYYFCPDPVVQIDPSPQPLHKFTCGSVNVISPFPRWFVFDSKTLPAALHELRQTGKFGTIENLWLFQGGWLVDHEPDVRLELAHYGCPTPRNFGANILVCELALPRPE